MLNMTTAEVAAGSRTAILHTVAAFMELQTSAAASPANSSSVVAVQGEGQRLCMQWPLFMGCLTNIDADGRIICSPAEGSVKFVLLNAATHFAKASNPLGMCDSTTQALTIGHTGAVAACCAQQAARGQHMRCSALLGLLFTQRCL